MFLKYRPARVSDLKECLECVRDGFAYDAEDRRDLLAFWRAGLADGSLDMLLMEDLDEAPGRRVLYFACKAGLTDEYAAQLKAGTPPTLGRHVLHLWREGCSPILPRARIAAANAGRTGRGVTMATLQNGTPALFGRGDLAFVMKKMVEFAPFSTSGYRLEEYLIEGYGPAEWAWLEGAGLRLRRDDAAQALDFPPGKGPRLYGVTEAEARERVGTMASVMFQWQPLRFGFTAAEQELLHCALSGDTDAELAAHLCVAPITVRKRWGAIYQRVGAAAPEVFEAGLTGGTKPGTEKKRRLLAYLCHHMEELRPHDLPANAAKP